MTTLESVTAKIEKAVPDAGFWMKERPIDFTLEDVLLALRNRKGGCATVTEGGLFSYENYATFETNESCWIIGKPLSEQSEETLSFLDSLLPPIE